MLGAVLLSFQNPVFGPGEDEQRIFDGELQVLGMSDERVQLPKRDEGHESEKALMNRVTEVLDLIELAIVLHLVEERLQLKRALIFEPEIVVLIEQRA